MNIGAYLYFFGHYEEYCCYERSRTSFVFFLLRIFSFLLGKYHILLHILTLQKMANLFSKVVVPFNTPTNSEWESQLFYILTNKWPYWSFKF